MTLGTKGIQAPSKEFVASPRMSRESSERSANDQGSSCQARQHASPDRVGGCVPRAQVKGINLSSVRIAELQKVQRIVRLIQETLYNHGGHFMRCEPPNSVGDFKGGSELAFASIS